MEMTTMVELFRDFWWLAFPLAWAIGTVWQGWLRGRARQDNMKLMAAYAASGREPPAELVKALDGRSDRGS